MECFCELLWSFQEVGQVCSLLFPLPWHIFSWFTIEQRLCELNKWSIKCSLGEHWHEVCLFSFSLLKCDPLSKGCSFRTQLVNTRDLFVWCYITNSQLSKYHWHVDSCSQSVCDFSQYLDEHFHKSSQSERHNRSMASCKAAESGQFVPDLESNDESLVEYIRSMTRSKSAILVWIYDRLDYGWFWVTLFAASIQQTEQRPKFRLGRPVPKFRFPVTRWSSEEN